MDDLREVMTGQDFARPPVRLAARSRFRAELVRVNGETRLVLFAYRLCE